MQSRVPAKADRRTNIAYYQIEGLKDGHCLSGPKWSKTLIQISPSNQNIYLIFSERKLFAKCYPIWYPKLIKSIFNKYFYQNVFILIQRRKIPINLKLDHVAVIINLYSLKLKKNWSIVWLTRQALGTLIFNT